MGLEPGDPGDVLRSAAAAEATPVRAYWTAPAEKNVKFEQYFRFNDYTVAVDRWRDLRQTPLPNLNLIDRLPLLNNFEPLLIGHFADYLDLIEATAAKHRRRCCKRRVSARPIRRIGNRWINRRRGRGCWERSAGTRMRTSLKAALVDPAWQPLGQLQMLGDGDCADPQPIAGDVAVAADEGNTLTLTVDAPRDSWLVVADTDYPGWVATVDGVETPIYRANLNFRAIQVDAGLHEVRFDYQPGWLLPGALVSVVSLLLALLLYRLGG